MTVDRRADQELRLALVMNGGISLAVWMAGVTQELNNVRLARLAPDAPATRASRAAWSAILDATATRITIDLAAGASAGGLNGTTLAQSVALGRELPDLRGLWVERASLGFGRLLRFPPRRPPTLLDGTYFHDEIRSLLGQHTAPTPAEDHAPTITLLVTATALPIPGASREGDDDSRRVYRFARRPGLDAGHGGIAGLPAVPELDDFGDVDTLALAARASASFPIAFPPVRESNSLQRQQLLPTRPEERWLMDGGVLDNAPFEPVLDDLRSRAVNELFRRVVVYVNPSIPAALPDAAGTAPSGDARGPGVRASLAGSVTAWRQIDRRLDREKLSDARVAAKFETSEPHEIIATLSSDAPLIDRDGLSRAAGELFARYQANRRQALYVASGASPRDAQGLALPAGLAPATCAARPEPGGGWQWGLAAADRVLRWWGRALRSRLTPQSEQTAFRALAPAQTIVRQWIDLFASLDADNVGRPEQWCRAAETFLREQDVPRLLAELMERTAVPVAAALRDPVAGPATDAAGPELLQASLEVEVIDRAVSWRPDAVHDVLPFDYWEVTPSAPCPPEVGHLAAQGGGVSSGGDGKNELRADWAARKLYGERWAHFGAFASRDGREWDYLWGRLDAAMSICDRLLEKELPAGVEAAALRSRLVQALLAEEGVTAGDVGERARRVTTLSGLGLALEWVGIQSSVVARRTREVARSLRRR